MKIISLNTWGGRAGKQELLAFFEKYKDVDIFCLQEIWSAPHDLERGTIVAGMSFDNETIMTEGLQKISVTLSEHVPYFRPHVDDNYGLLMLVKKDHNIIQEGEQWVYKHRNYIPNGDLGNHARNIQYVTFEKDGKPFTVINFHGIWNGMGKTDTEDRILQSKNIIEFTKTLNHDFILMGDFNLLPDTESIKLFEEAGLKNLIKEYGITSTRTSFYTKPILYADYAFVTTEIGIKEFKVLPEEVSDHTALYLEIE